MTVFDAYEIHPCVLLNEHGSPVKNDDPTGRHYERCEDNDPEVAVWGLYGHLPLGGLEHIEDYPSWQEAEAAYAQVSG